MREFEKQEQSGRKGLLPLLLLLQLLMLLMLLTITMSMVSDADDDADTIAHHDDDDEGGDVFAELVYIVSSLSSGSLLFLRFSSHFRALWSPSSGSPLSDPLVPFELLRFSSHFRALWSLRAARSPCQILKSLSSVCPSSQIRSPFSNPLVPFERSAPYSLRAAL